MDMFFASEALFNYLLGGVLLVGCVVAAFRSYLYREGDPVSGEEREMEQLTREFEYYMVGGVVMLFGFVIYAFGALAGLDNLFNFATAVGAVYVSILVVAMGRRVVDAW